MILKLIFVLLMGFNLFAQDFTLDSFRSQLSSRQSRVEEFQFIKESASKLGIKNVYMFGGTAAAWAHYVRWDMRRELGIENLQADRFDYDYTNIFRANQDFDLVVDASLEQAAELENIIQKKFNYFSGPRATWEVRLLNEQRDDKEPLLGHNFQNQHSDSHSTGLIEMLNCHQTECVKDIRDMGKIDNQFIKDVFEARLHYYHSSKHKQTQRYLAGLNPEILSVIRYFTKAVQYNLHIRPEDKIKLQEVINKFDPVNKLFWSKYVDKWLEKNAKKLILNAVDMEFAIDLLESVGLRQKLIKLGSPKNEGSMSWWLNKEALRSSPVGQGNGKTARVIFNDLYKAEDEIILAHETNNFSAYESITKAHDGFANALISRKKEVGEVAVYGNGHYTNVGKKGARGTGITVRYTLNPEAREGSDFERVNNFVIIKNKKAVKVIQESQKLSYFEYFEMIANGLVFDFNDKGVSEKLKRKFLRRSKVLTEDELHYIENEIVLKNPTNPSLVSEWNKLILNHSFKMSPELTGTEALSTEFMQTLKVGLKNRKRIGRNVRIVIIGTIALSIPFFVGVATGNKYMNDMVKMLLLMPSVVGMIVGTAALPDPDGIGNHAIKGLFKYIDKFTNKFAQSISINSKMIKNWAVYNTKHKTGVERHSLYSFSNTPSIMLETVTTDDNIVIKFSPSTIKAYPIKKYQQDMKTITSKLIKDSRCQLLYKAQ